MALTQKQEKYARAVASGMDNHTAALEAGCKSHDSARKFVADMAKRENVQAFIKSLKTAQSGEQAADTERGYESPLEFLKSVFNDKTGLYGPKERITAAVALLPYTEQKIAPIGKKEGEIDNAVGKSKTGKFATLSNQTDMFVSDTRQ